MKYKYLIIFLVILGIIGFIFMIIGRKNVKNNKKDSKNTSKSVKDLKKEIKKKDYDTKKLLAQQKYLKYMLNETYDDTNTIDIKLDNNSDICIIMIGTENIYSFYENAIDINYLYANNMGYDFIAIIGRILDKDKYKPHYDRYKLLLNTMENKNYKYILYIDSDAFVQIQNKRIEDFINYMDSDSIILGSWDCGSATIDKRILPLNTGVILMKNCQKSIELCNDILTKEPECYLERCKCVGSKATVFYDQCVIDRLHSYHKMIKLLPYGVLQSFDRDPSKCVGKKDTNNKSFILHYAGSPLNKRNVDFKKYQQQIVNKYNNNIDKNWIDDIFDKVYVITIDKRLEYIKYIMSIMKINPIIFKGVDKNNLDKDHLIKNKIVSPNFFKNGNKGKIACHLSHIEVLKKFLKTKAENCLIFEDDIMMPENISHIKEYMENTMKVVPTNWDVIYFGRCWDNCKDAIIINQYLMKSQPVCRHAYAVSRKGAKIIIENTKPQTTTGDKMYKKLNIKGLLDIYSTIEPLFFQNRTDISSEIGHNYQHPVCKKF